MATINYPETLPLGLYSGRSYQVVSPLLRSDLTNGRARQRRRFTDVPENASIGWIFTSAQCVVFEAWFRDALSDGVEWFNCPLETPLGFMNYVCRFTGIYQGPSRLGPKLWSVNAELELQSRALLPAGAGLFPDYLADASILDTAVNSLWPNHRWQGYVSVADTAINSTWPAP